MFIVYLLLSAASPDERDPDEQQKLQKYIDGLKKKRPSKTSTLFSAASKSAVGRATFLSFDVLWLPSFPSVFTDSASCAERGSASRHLGLYVAKRSGTLQTSSV